MKTMHNPLAKIVNHSDGLGVPSPDTVRQRAIELARIDGRAEFTEEDWQRARVELHGGHPFDSNESDGEMIATLSEHDMVISDVGHRVEAIRYDDEGSAVELVAEGMDEAEHERMLSAAEVESEEVD